MLKTLLSNKITVSGCIVLLAMLAMVRGFEESLFYDPFLHYFKGEFQGTPLPQFEMGRLLLHLGFRYFLNTAISLSLIYVIFKDRGLIKFTALLYVILFVVLLAAFVLVVSTSTESDGLTLFYIRRFLIQPLFVVLFIPAFYYQKLMLKK